MGSKRLLPIVHELVDLLVVHFHQEHIVMIKSNYPGFLEHSQEHQRFVDKIKEFFEEYK
jgi:hemerythrin